MTASTRPARPTRRARWASGPLGWFRRTSLRGRLMVIGLTGSAVALLAGGLALFGALGVTVNRSLDTEATATAREVAVLVADDRLPAPIPVSGAQLIQVVDGQSRVVGGSLLADRLTPLLRQEELTRALGGRSVQVPGNRAGLTGPLRVVAVPAGNDVSVVVALPVADVLATRQTLRTVLLVAFPLVLAVLAVIAWRVIGSTLRPVEALRTGAEQISGGTDNRRLPVPVAADEIRALAVTLNGMLDRLAAGRERQRAFVADAAHELRSPLASIRTQLEVARHLGEGGSLTEDLLTDVERLSALVEDLLLLARSDADRRPPVAPQVFDATALLTELAARPVRRGVEVTGVADAHPALVEADRSELRRALANLVDNAVRHARSRVGLAAVRRGDRVQITVDDDGPGIAPVDRERVFDRFTRLDDARGRDAGGSGLGLAIVRDLVVRSGGTVGFQDAPEGWSLRAMITVPAADMTSRSR